MFYVLGLKYHVFDDGQVANPYHGYLAFADYLIVTPGGLGGARRRHVAGCLSGDSQYPPPWHVIVRSRVSEDG